METGERDASRLEPPPRVASAVAGAVAGGVLGGALGAGIGLAYSVIFMPNAELEGVLPFVIGMGGGAWIGAALGCFVVLRLSRADEAASTAKWVAALFVPAVVAGFFLGIAGEHVERSLFYVGLVVPPLVVAPMLARFLSLRAGGR